MQEPSARFGMGTAGLDGDALSETRRSPTIFSRHHTNV